jgi:hypothetical protein
MRRSAAAVLAVVLTLAMAGCGGDDDSDEADASSTTTTEASSTTGSSTTTSTSTTPPDEEPSGSCPERPAGSSPAEFDDSAGTYAVHVQEVDLAARSVSFDVVQWLVGQDAIDAYHQEVADDPDGPSNDYYVVNENDTVRTAAISESATVHLVRLGVGDISVKPGTVEELPSYLEATSLTIWWLTFDAGHVVEICEQYTP